jgi:thiol-disulfide isomerase/thioredoxin
MLDPKWDQLVETHQNGVSFGKLNCADYGKYCRDKGIIRTPTIQANINGGEWKEYSGDFSLDSVDAFIGDNQIKRNTQGESIELTQSAQLKKIIDSKEPWFVKFYAPWCGHCKHLAPVWDKMAKQLQNKVNIAEVNCEDNKGKLARYLIGTSCMCRRSSRLQLMTYSVMPRIQSDRFTYFDLVSLDVLLYYRKLTRSSFSFVYGGTLKYTGERKLEKLAEYALKMSGSPVHNVDTDSEFEDLFKARDVNLVYVRNAKNDNNQLTLLEKVAPQFMETIPFYTTTDRKTALRFQLKESDLPAAVIVKDGTYYVYQDQGIEGVASWVHQERSPLVTRILPHNSNSIFKGKQMVVVGITDPDDTDSEFKLREMAKIYRDEQQGKDLTFALMDGKLYGNYVSRAYGIYSNKLPSIVVLDPKNQVYYNRHANEEPFSINNPDEILQSIKAPDTLKGVSTAPSKAMGVLERTFIKFGEHWIIFTTILFGLFGVMFWLLTQDEPARLTTEQIKEIAKKEVEERKDKEENKTEKKDI